jgi:hypothetical protein
MTDILARTAANIQRALAGSEGPLGWRMAAADYAVLCQQVSDVQAETGNPVLFQGIGGMFVIPASEKIAPLPGILVVGVPVYPYEVN